MGDYAPITTTTGGTTTDKTKKPTGPVTKSQTQVTTQRYNSQQAQGIALSAFQNAIGREPTSDELSKFLTALNAAESSHPDMYSGSTTTSVGGSTTGGVSSGGIDESAFAQQYAESLPGFAGYQKATTYFDAFTKALRGEF